jgi:rhamnogalacturonan acetylesterase
MRLLFCSLFIFLLTLPLFAAAPKEINPSLPTLFIIGDSTVNNHANGALGWGDPVKSLFDEKRINVVNRARGGRSSRTFFTEGLWGKVLDDMKPGDYLLMQFGHNDSPGLMDPKGKGRGSIKGNGDETADGLDEHGKIETVHAYGWYLRKFISDAKAKGVHPIVLSMVPRNNWTADHKIILAGNDYGKWAAEAAKQESVPFINLNEIIAEKYDKMTPEQVKSEYFTPVDNTHTSPAGAKVNAASVVEGIRDCKDSDLKNYILSDGAAGSGPK